MARPLRLQFPGGIYHVTARGNDRQAIFADDADRSRFLIVLAFVVERYRVRCHAYCLMGNHYHLLLETPDANLSAAMRQLNGVYTQGFNRRHERCGHLLQGRFGAHVVDGQSYLYEVCRYIVLNPVRAGLVSHPRGWVWSSFRATAGQTPAPGFLTVGWVRALSGLRSPLAAAQAYVRFIEAGLGDDRDAAVARLESVRARRRRCTSRMSAGSHSGDPTRSRGPSALPAGHRWSGCFPGRRLAATGTGARSPRCVSMATR